MEFKFNPEPPLKFRFINKTESEQSLLLAARYGLYSNDDSYAFLEKNFKASPIIYDAQFKAALRPGAFYTPLSLTGYNRVQRRQIVHSFENFSL